MKLKNIIALLQSETGLIVEKVSTKDTNLTLPNDFFIKESYRIIKWRLIHHTNNLKIESILTSVFDYDWKVNNIYLTHTKKETITWLKNNYKSISSITEKQ